MSSIVIALPKIEDARKIRSVLERHGFAVASVCSTASNALFQYEALAFSSPCAFFVPAASESYLLY